MSTTTATPQRFHVLPVVVHDVREGHVIDINGVPTTVADTRIRKVPAGYAYDITFEGGTPMLSAMSSATLQRLVAFPKVGTFATLCYPSDRYPLIVTKVSATGSKIELVRLDYRIVSGNFQSGNVVVEYSMPQGATSTLAANWSPRRGCYTIGGTPVSIGTARYYQSPEV